MLQVAWLSDIATSQCCQRHVVVHGNECFYENAANVKFNVVINEKVTSNQGVQML